MRTQVVDPCGRIRIERGRRIAALACRLGHGASLRSNALPVTFDLRRPFGGSQGVGSVGMDLALTGKHVVVTGAGSGIGLAVVRAFVAEGAHVIAGSLHISSELQELADEGMVVPVAVDLAEPSGPAELIAAAEGRIDVLVNN